MMIDEFKTCFMELLGGLKYLVLGVIMIIKFPFDLISCTLFTLGNMIEGE